MTEPKTQSLPALPDFFRPLLWSYDFSAVDIERDKKTIVINTINYGDLTHWRWIIKQYGRDEVRRMLMTVSATEIKPRARRLAAILFSIDEFNYASRGAN